ncbi:MAG: hypothetical protein V8S57_04530 [Oscillospiraceae bacterium]
MPCAYARAKLDESTMMTPIVSSSSVSTKNGRSKLPRFGPAAAFAWRAGSLRSEIFM